jgi:hypothetical protein
MDPTQPTPQPISPQPTPNTPVVTPPLPPIPPTPSVSDQPQVITPSVLAPEESETPKPKNKLKVILSVFFSLVILALVASSALAYAVAYDKIKLSKNPDLQNKISLFVQNLSFMPKTPKYVFAQAAIAQEKITKESFDISLAIDSKDFSKMIGLSSLDMAAKGKIDYTDPKDPKVSVDISITKDFNLELRKSDPVLFFKINKLPGLLLAAIGLKTEQFEPLTGKWIALDTTPLSTEARKNLEDQEVEPLSRDFVSESIGNFLDDRVLSKLAMEKTTIDGNAVYKISMTADADLIDYLSQKVDEASKRAGGASLDSLTEPGAKLSDMVKRLSWEFNVDQKDYYIRKVVISTDLEVDQSGYGNLFLGTSTSASNKSNISIAFAVKLDDFGKEVLIEKPTDSITFEEFTSRISDIFKEIYGSMIPNTSGTP